jgi:hypothetical protein
MGNKFGNASTLQITAAAPLRRSPETPAQAAKKSRTTPHKYIDTDLAGVQVGLTLGQTASGGDSKDSQKSFEPGRPLATPINGRRGSRRFGDEL